MLLDNSLPTSRISSNFLHSEQFLVFSGSNSEIRRIRPNKGREQQKEFFFFEQILRNFRYKKQLLTFLATFYEITENFLGNLEQHVGRRTRSP